VTQRERDRALAARFENLSARVEGHRNQTYFSPNLNAKGE
jgi:hypothetical protein